MFPGLQSRLSAKTQASAATITVDTDLVVLTGAVQVNTILTASQNQATWVTIVPTTGALIFGTSGNILVGATVAQNRPCTFFWIPSLGKWVIGPIS
jgi:hypothetical protein